MVAAPEALSPEQIARRIKRDELYPLFAEVFGGAFQPIDEGDDLLDGRTAGAHRAHRLHHRSAFGRDVVEQNDVGVGLEIAGDLSLGAVVFDLLAHHEAVDGAAMPAADTHGAVTRGLDPRVHLLRKNFIRSGWIAGSSPAMTSCVRP